MKIVKFMKFVKNVENKPIGNHFNWPQIQIEFSPANFYLIIHPPRRWQAPNKQCSLEINCSEFQWFIDKFNFEDYVGDVCRQYWWTLQGCCFGTCLSNYFYHIDGFENRFDWFSLRLNFIRMAVLDSDEGSSSRFIKYE